MHVVFLPSWYPADTSDIRGIFFREQAIALRQGGAKVGVVAPSLVSLGKPYEVLSSTKGVRRNDDNGVVTYRVSAPNLTPRVRKMMIAQHRALTMRLFKLYASENGLPDIVHVHGALPIGTAAQEVQQMYNIPYVLSEHSSSYARGILSSAQLASARRTAMSAVRRFAVSTPFSKLLEQKLNLDAGSIEVFPNPVSNSFLDHAISTPKASVFRFLHVSLLDEMKNVSSLLHAFAQAFGGRDDILLSIGGDGPTAPLLKSLAAELGISRQVRFLGALSRSEVASALFDADAFVLSSRYETFGVVVVEALAMGVPVIATRCGGPEDIVGEGDGILVPVGDITAMAQAMGQISRMSGSETRESRRERCRGRYAADSVAKKWLGVYEAALRHNGSAP